MRVGLVGIGNMGFAMAERLHERGWLVAVRDIDPVRERDAAKRGMTVCASPGDVAAQSECVIVAVVDAAQVDRVLFEEGGVTTPASRAASCVMLCPTIAPNDTVRIATKLAEQHIDCIDAPMSGGPAMARDGRMSLMVACADAVFEQYRRLIETLSTNVFRLGERVGDGARTKLVNNLLAGVNLAGAAEAMALAERLGLDLTRTLDVIEHSSGQSWIGSDRMRRALQADGAVRAHLSLLAKDTALAIARRAGCGLRAEPRIAHRSLVRAGLEQGLRDRDDASLFEHLRGRRC